MVQTNLRSRKRRLSFAAVAVAVLLVLAATLLPGNAIEPDQAPPRWCLACGGLWVMDAVSNVLLFAPLGAALAGLRVRWPWALLMGAALSLTVETLQSLGIPPGRSAALADVVANTAGTAVGLLAVRWGPALVMAEGRAAVWLTAAWLAMVAGVITITTLALGPRRADPEPDPDRFHISRFEYSPGLGWYDGEPRQAVVNGHMFPHRGTGPVVIAVPAEPSSLTVEGTVLGRDTATNTRSFVYVHREDDTLAVAMLAQKGDDAVFSSTRRAWLWGLAMPGARLRGVFAGRTPDDPRPLRLIGHSDRTQLMLTEPVTGTTNVVRLEPTMGWAMIQTLVNVHHPLAPAVLTAWLLTLFLPLGWWGTRSGRHAPWVLGGVTIAVLALFPALQALSGVASLPALQWSVIGLSIALGVLIDLATQRSPEGQRSTIRA